MARPLARQGLLFAAGLGLACAAVWAAITISIAWQSQWSGPFRDLWEMLQPLEAAFSGHWQWQALWEPYGGAHRLLVPQLLFILDLHGLQGSNRVPLLASIACQCLVLVLVVRRVRGCYPDEPLLAWLAAPLGLATLFSATQLYNLNYSISSQWFLATGFGTLALFLASQPAGATRRPWHTLLLGTIALLASLVNSAGILLWPVLLYLLWLQRYPRSQLALLLAMAGLTITAYLYRMAPGLPTGDAGHRWQWLLGMALYSLGFVTGFLGSPLSRHWPAVASLLALALLAILLRDAWRQRQRPQPDAPLRLMVAGMALHATLIAFTAGLGRTMYPGMQTTERYQTVALFFWLAVALAALGWAQRRGGSWRLLLPLPLLLAALAFDYHHSARKHLQLANTVRQAHIGIALGVTDLPVAIHTLSYPAGRQGHNYVARHAGFLAEHRLGPWASPWLAWLGQAAPGNTSACQLQVQPGDAINPEGARPVQVSGDCPQEYLLLGNERHEVVGLARRALPHWPALLSTPPYWVGYAVREAQTLQAIPIDHLPQGRTP